jgi:hypothetical protein
MSGFLLLFLSTVPLLAGSWGPWEDPQKPIPARLEVSPDNGHSPVGLTAAVLVRVYQTVLSPLVPTQCNFHPTCSEFALASFRRTNAIQGCLMAADRLLRDHHGLAGYYDYDRKRRAFLDPVEDHLLPIPVLSWFP